MKITIGQKVHVTKMATDSFYLQVIGVVTGARNGFVQIEATKVMDKYSKKWAIHPTSCTTFAKIENVVSI